MRFGENKVWDQNILRYINFGCLLGEGEGVKWSTLHFFFHIHKNRKSTRAWPTLKLNSTSFWFLKKFPRMNKNFRKRGTQGAPLLFLYKESIVVLIDFIAILLTPGIFLIQIVNTNNTNMYLIHFLSEIKMRFPKSRVFKVSKLIRHS